MTWFGLLSWPAMVLQILGSDLANQQRTQDFSGTWSLVEFRIGEDPATNQSEIIGGAPINCGRECTIVQSPDMLRVSRFPNKEGTMPRAAVVYLDNRLVSGNATVTAKWDGTRLVLARTFASINVTQTLSIEKERLIVDVAVAASRVGPYRLTYERK
jgi:hypothetical protein